ncbi:hypothetical protein ACF1AE_24080 [Streptomyces sp. NPDC014986]|uniref:hypothetical protein n=1 Tax=Streptomyces sp. NPDC014986 TaxID=3364934 RepID=UPI0036FD3B50
MGGWTIRRPGTGDGDGTPGLGDVGDIGELLPDRVGAALLLGAVWGAGAGAAGHRRHG